MTLNTYLSSLVDGGKIASYSFGEVYVPLHDLSGRKSAKIRINYYAQIIHANNGKRETLAFDGATEQQVIEQVKTFFENSL